MNPSSSSPEGLPPIDHNQHLRVAQEVGHAAVSHTITLLLKNAWNRIKSLGRSAAEAPLAPSQWIVDANAEGQPLEGAAYVYLMNRFTVPDASEADLPATVVRDLEELNRDELKTDRQEERTWIGRTYPVDIFSGTVMSTAYEAAEHETGIPKDTHLARARELHVRFLDDPELVAQFNAYSDYLVSRLTPERATVVAPNDTLRYASIRDRSGSAASITY